MQYIYTQTPLKKASTRKFTTQIFTVWAYCASYIAGE